MPTPQETTRVPELFAEAQALAPTERDAFLARACGGDESLRAEVESLLRCRTEAAGFLETPAANVGAALFAHEAANGELPPGHLLGDCRIVSLLGVGGMGEVYLAQDITLDRPVAIKLVQHGWGGTVLRQFQHERRVLAGLNHPHIARLYGSAVTPEGRAYLVMEYVEGERLDEYCRRRQLGVADCLALFRKVCAAVAYAHQNLVVHRDLKPANIRVTPEGEPKLLDFGIAKLLEAPAAAPGAEPALTLTGAMTPEYASPEQLRGEAITTGSDVYSLGVVFYELLSGQRPYRFPSRRPEEMARVICEQEPERPSSVAARAGPESLPRPPHRRLSRDLDNIAAMAMRKEPARRYSSVAQFSEDIRRHCEGLPVIARKETIPYVASRFVRRHKPAVAAVAFVALALVGALVTTTSQRNRARLAQAQAERLNGFLQTLLGSADPDNGQGRELKVVQVLDRAGQTLDHELAGEPVLLAQAHLTIGQAYGRLQDTEPCLRHLRAALDIDRRVYGDDHIVTARTKAFLGVALITLERRYAEAEPLLHQALAVERRQPAAEQRELPMTLDYEARAMTQLDHPGEARKMALESLSLIRQTDGEQSEAYAGGLMHLGSLSVSDGDYAKAEAPYRQAVAIFRQRQSHGPRFAGMLTALSYDLILLGKLDEPEGLLREAQGIYRGTVGEQSMAYCQTIGDLGWLHFLRGDFPAAEAEFGAALAYLRTLEIPEGEQDFVGGKVLFGLAQTRNGKAAEAEPLLRECLVLAKSNGLTGNALPTNVMAGLGECLVAQGRYPEAEELFVAAYHDLKASLGEKDALTLKAAGRLQAFYLAWTKLDRNAHFFDADAH